MGNLEFPISDHELSFIERTWNEGVTSHQIIQLLAERGVPFSEATLRKYVQLGLLPRSRRVGLKGKHRGSQGLYPASAIRRIGMIRRLMGESHTIGEVRELLGESFVLEELRRDVDRMLAGLGARLERMRASGRSFRVFSGELAGARQAAEELVERIERIERESRPGGKRPLVAVPPGPAWRTKES